MHKMFNDIPRKGRHFVRGLPSMNTNKADRIYPQMMQIQGKDIPVYV